MAIGLLMHMAYTVAWYGERAWMVLLLPLSGWSLLSSSGATAALPASRRSLIRRKRSCTRHPESY
jgi:hypothetical protein